MKQEERADRIFRSLHLITEAKKTDRWYCLGR